LLDAGRIRTELEQVPDAPARAVLRQMLDQATSVAK